MKERFERFLRNPSPSLHGLSLTGLTPFGLHLIQRWLERTGDIQTAAILSSFFPLSRLSLGEKSVVNRWRGEYREMLDGWGMWGARVALDVNWMELGRRMGDERGEERETCPACVSHRCTKVLADGGVLGVIMRWSAAVRVRRGSSGRSRIRGRAVNQMSE